MIEWITCILLLGIGGYILFQLFFYIGYWIDTHDGKWTKMKWSMLKSLYYLNSDRWEYKVGCRYDDSSKILIYDNNIRVLVSFLSWYRVKYYWKHNQKRLRKNNSNKAMEEIINVAQTDITWRMEEAKVCIEKAKEEMNKACGRRKKSRYYDRPQKS